MIGSFRIGDVFVHGSWWWTPALVVALYGFQRGVDRARSRRIAEVLGPRAGLLSGELDAAARRRKQRWSALALSFGLLAWMEPTWGERPIRLDRSGADLVVCLDVSRSMLARDIPGAGVELTRLDAAKREIEMLARETRGDRLALVAFAGDARLVAPLTRDTDTWIQLSAGLDPTSVQKGGTDLAAAIDTALLAVERGGDAGARAAILLLTDGEDFGDASERAVAAARSRGVPLFGVGLGSELGSKVVLDVAGRAEFLTDKDGADVISKLDLEGLEQMTRATGGSAVRASAEPGALSRLYEEEVSRVARGQAASGGARDRESRYQWPLALAFLLWILELADSERRRARGSRFSSRARGARDWERAAFRPRGGVVARTRVIALVAGSAVTMAGCGERGPGAIRAYQEGRVDEALAGFRDAVARAGDDASAPLFDAHALAAIALGKWREAEVALEMARVRGGRSMEPRWEFLMGNVEYGRCEQITAQAMDVASEPFAFDLAIVHAERSLAHWKTAAVTRNDWPEARRNVERALRKLGDLHAARAEAEARREKKKEKAPPEEQPEVEPESEEVARKAQRLDADPELVNRILERLSARDQEKREVRAETRRERSAPVERDW